MQFVPCTPDHIRALIVQDAQEHLIPVIEDSTKPEAIVAGGEAFSAIDDDAYVIGCAGVVDIWNGRMSAWAMLSECGPHNFLPIHRAVKRFLDERNYRRVETLIDTEHEAGHKWAHLLGFKWEGTMFAAGVDGRD